MFTEILGISSDVFSVIGAVAVGVVAFRIAIWTFRFLTCHFFAKYLGLSANLKLAGSWAVVTGCTDGIGKAYAEQLAARGLNVALISRTQSKLEELAKEIEIKYKVQTVVIAADFSRDDIYDDIRTKLQDLNIGVLVNNVGTSYEYPEYFDEVDAPNFIRRMINTNCTSVAKMTEIVLPEMAKKRIGYVISIGSSAGSSPTPFLSLYSGTKAYVEKFSNSLNQEYSQKGITFQCVKPYFVVSKLSKFRRPTTAIPTPTTFVKNALNTVGIQAMTTGYWAHELQDVYFQYIPNSVKKDLLLQARARAHKKIAAAKTE